MAKKLFSFVRKEQDKNYVKPERTPKLVYFWDFLCVLKICLTKWTFTKTHEYKNGKHIVYTIYWPFTKDDLENAWFELATTKL